MFFEVELNQLKFMKSSLNFKFLLLIIFIQKCYLLKLENTIQAKEVVNNFLQKDEIIKYNQVQMREQVQVNQLNLNSLNQVNYKTKIADKRKQEMGKGFNTDFSTLKRDLKFYVSKTTKCDVQVTDTVLFRKETDTNFIEHWILHNNVEDIDPKGVTSNDINIRYFTFNRKMNAFAVYFNFDENHVNKQEFTITFQYEAVNLIKSYNNFPEGGDNDAFFLENKSNVNSGNIINYNYNTFLWKLYNKNFPSVGNEYISIEIIFDLGNDFSKYTIYSTYPEFNFKKIVEKVEELTTIKYLWNGKLDSQEVVVMEVKFPLYFENCKYFSVNFFMVVIGSIFIVFVILMLYVVFNSVMFNDL
jgi:hypothetical protein